MGTSGPLHTSSDFAEKVRRGSGWPQAFQSYVQNRRAGMTKQGRKKSQNGSYHREAITPIEYSGLQQAYDHFNAELFGGGLGDVFITYQRRANSFGYFSPDRFSGRVDQSGNHELALNPDGFINQTD